MIKLYMQIYIRLNNKLVYLYLFILKEHYENIICAIVNKHDIEDIFKEKINKISNSDFNCGI